MSLAQPLGFTANLRDRYDAWANSYDDWTARYGWTAPQVLLKAAIEHLPPSSTLRVLDVGVGTGQASIPYLEVGACVTGLDIAPKMLEQTQAKWPQFHALLEHDFNCPLLETGLQERSFDLIISSGALHFTDDLRSTLAELRRVLAPGGYLAFTYIPPQKRVFSSATRYYEPKTVAPMMQSLSLDIVHYEAFVAYYEGSNLDDPVVYQLILAHCPEPRQSLPETLQTIDRTACVDRARLLKVASHPLMSGALTTQWTEDLARVQSANQSLREALRSQLYTMGEVIPDRLPLPNCTAKPACLNKPGCEVLAIVPHPDDESVYAGGTIAALSEAGQSVRLVVATDGAGGRGGKGANLAAQRLDELNRAARILAIEQVECLGFVDFGKYRDRARTQPTTATDALRCWGLEQTLFALVSSIRQHRPRVILTLHPEVDPNYSLHGHHLGLGTAVLIAFHLAADPTFTIPDKPDLLAWAVDEHRAMVPQHHSAPEAIYIEIDRKQKAKALRAYSSQQYSTERLIQALETGSGDASFERVQVLQARRRQPQVTAVPLVLGQQTSPSATHSDWLSAYRAISQRHYPREALFALLQQQAARRGASAEVLASIEQLRLPETVAVVTGQQVGLFGGPAYTLYKALGAIRLARHLQKQKIPAVPVFWMATYDHDLDEVQSLSVLAGNKEPEQLGLGLKVEQHPVVSIKLGTGIHSLLDKVERSLLPLPYCQEVMAQLRASYRPEQTFAEAFAQWFGQLSDRFGLILLDPATPEFARLTHDVLYRELFGTERSQAALEQARRELEATGRAEVIPTDRDWLQLFYVDEDGARCRLRRIQNGFALQQRDTYLADDAVQRVLKEQPERFTPSALLRPICQDAVLPTIAYIAGPTEQQYFAQLPPVYTWAGLPLPKILSRPSFTLVGETTVERLKEAGGAAALLNGNDASDRLGRAGLPHSVRSVYDELVRLQQRSFTLREAALVQKVDEAAVAIERDLNQWLVEAAQILTLEERKRLQETLRSASLKVRSLLTQICADLERSGNQGGPPPTRNLATLARELTRLERAFLKEGRRHNAAGVTAFARINPKGSPQERQLNLAELVAEYGFSIGQLLLPLALPESGAAHLVAIR